ncbi:Magnetosome protein Mad17 involved in iron transport into magnetosomes Mad17-1 [Candidatus Desulfarcum epimagneticum]|uniref:Magnetosome protein Mad17 involved in iron transport into magnetosomes Mad17-1 n=1 Tax=uncultured Desulfobacteraceae bacterium TaxID=218296 RepID=A0A484HHD8_9BACT|nr:Magnetosome protein Mad17 involved in iron transport into magnetosomes Mad17-1 [uncultured Desulfobacteraceae bacterium]
MKTDFVIVGNMNVGKSTLFGRLTQNNGGGVNIPGTTLSVKRGKIKGTDTTLYDTPGIHSIFSANEDERASRDILLLPDVRDRLHGLALVADAKNLKRSIAIALQYAEYGLPMVLNVNMTDESASRGIDIDYAGLSGILGAQVFETIANEGIGVEKLKSGLKKASPLGVRTGYPDDIEEFILLVEKLITTPTHISKRAIALLLLTRDRGVESYITGISGESQLRQLKQLAKEYRDQALYSIDIALENFYFKEAEKIVNQVQTTAPPSKNPFIQNLGDWSTRFSTGIPIALMVVVAMYYFVGSFAATFLVDSINTHLFENMLIPALGKMVDIIPIRFLRDMIMDPDFGVLPTGVFLALGLVLPVIFCFYIAFGILEDSGYLPRISILLDKIFKKIGLNGKGVIPLVMGFSCITMSLLTTRMLNSEKERNIASFLVFLCMPCAPLLAVMLVILDKMPLHATIAVFGTIFLQILIAGYFADKILPGARSSMIMEIPAMRAPRLMPVIQMASKKSYHFMKEAIPVFVFAAIAVFLFQRMGGLEVLENSLGPAIDKILGLPEKSIQVFIKTMIRRESGAAELQHLRDSYTNLQMVVNLVVMTLIAPCVNAIIVLFKERGMRAGSAILITVSLYAVVIGSAVNYVCRLLNITFA